MNGAPSKSPDTATEQDVAWVAALLSAGAGSFTTNPIKQGRRTYTYPVIQFSGHNVDELLRLAGLWGVRTRWHHASATVQGAHRRRSVKIGGTNARAWMERMRPMLSAARVAQMDAVLAQCGITHVNVPSLDRVRRMRVEDDMTGVHFGRRLTAPLLLIPASQWLDHVLADPMRPEYVRIPDEEQPEAVRTPRPARAKPVDGTPAVCSCGARPGQGHRLLCAVYS